MKILNLYAGIGGNRKLWGQEHDITAIELDETIADYYKSLYPDDNVVVADAHEFLLHNFQLYDFIWSSPPCPSHSRINMDGNKKPCFPDMKLYEEIIFLSNNWFKGLYVVENVIPYYSPLIEPKIKLERHLFWSNFCITNICTKKEKPISLQNGKQRYGFDISDIKFNKRKDQILRNLVNPEIGFHILNCAQKKYYNKLNEKQLKLEII